MKYVTLIAAGVSVFCMPQLIAQEPPKEDPQQHAVKEEQHRAAEEENSIYEPKDMDDAADYIISSALECEPKILLHFPKKVVSKNEVIKLSMPLREYRLALSFTYSIQTDGKSSTAEIEPQYMSCVRMIRSLHAPKSVKLTRREEEALAEAGEIIRSLNLDQQDNKTKARRIHDWLVANCSYDLPGLKIRFSQFKDGESYSPYDGKYMILDHKGVCDSYSQAYWLLLQMVDVPSCMIHGHSKRGSQKHSWNLVYLDDHWGHVDVTWDDPVPDVPGRVTSTYFDLTEKEMAKSHKWSKNLFSTEHKVMNFETVAEFVAYLKKERKRDRAYTVTIAEAKDSESFSEQAAAEAAKAGLKEKLAATADAFFPGALRVRLRKSKR